jgi:hypothetical protein
MGMPLPLHMQADLIVVGAGSVTPRLSSQPRGEETARLPAGNPQGQGVVLTKSPGRGFGVVPIFTETWLHEPAVESQPARVGRIVDARLIR